MLLGMLSLLLSCSGTGRIPELNAFCAGLAGPIDTLADTLLEHSSNTPGEVIVAATKVVVGYDGGCKDG